MTTSRRQSVVPPAGSPVPGADRPARPACDPAVTYCLTIHAAADPGVMPRVLELFAKRNLVPSRWHSDLTRLGGGVRDQELVIDVQLAGLAVEEGDYIAACLRQQVCVQSVLTSVKTDAGRDVRSA